MNEIKISFKSNYTQIPNELLRDSTISLKAKGMFALLISHGEGYQFSSMRLVIESKDGEHATKESLKELEKGRYLTRNRQSDGRVQYVLSLPEEKPKCENPTMRKSHNEKIPQRENHPNKEDRSLKNIDNNKNTDINTVVTRTEIPEECYEIADLLISFVSKQWRQDKSRSRSKWADIIRKMVTVDKVEIDLIKRAFVWYSQLEDYSQYCPVIKSAQSLREKWVNLINFSKKLVKQSKQKDSIDQQTISDIQLLNNQPQGK